MLTVILFHRLISLAYYYARNYELIPYDWEQIEIFIAFALFVMRF